MERRQDSRSATGIRYLRIVHITRIAIVMVLTRTPPDLLGARFKRKESQHGITHLPHIMIQSVHSSEHAINTTKQSRWRYLSRQYGRVAISKLRDGPLVPLFPARMLSPANFHHTATTRSREVPIRRHEGLMPPKATRPGFTSQRISRPASRDRPREMPPAHADRRCGEGDGDNSVHAPTGLYRHIPA